MKVEVTNYRKLTGGALKGVFSVTIADFGGMQINNCKHFVSTLGGEWFKFPDEKGKPKDDGKATYYQIIRVQDKAVEKALQDAIINAIANYKHEVPNVSSKAATFNEDLLSGDEAYIW
jgi:hypothetical protein